MIAARWPGYVGLAIGGLALAIGLVARGGKDDDDALEEFARSETRRRRDVTIDQPPPPLDDDDGDDDDDDDDTVTVEVRLDGVMVNGSWHSDDDLTDLIRARGDADLTAVVRSSSDLPYARVVAVLDLLRDAGVTNVSMQAAPATP